MAEVLSTYAEPLARRRVNDADLSESNESAPDGETCAPASATGVADSRCGPAARVAPLDEKSACGVTVADARHRTRADAVDREATRYSTAAVTCA